MTDRTQPPFTGPEDYYHLPGHDYTPWAVHEAGHALAVVATGVGRVYSVSLATQFGINGRCQSEGWLDQDDEQIAGNEVGREHLRAKLVVALAGVAAEVVAGHRDGGLAEWLKEFEDDYGTLALYAESEPGTDCSEAVRLAGLSGTSVEDGWNEAVRLLSLPVVREAVEMVARELMRLKDAGSDPRLSRSAFEALLGGLERFRAMHWTSVDHARAALVSSITLVGRLPTEE